MREVWEVCGRDAGREMLGVWHALTLTPGGAFRFHWPMQGPHALARTVAPAFSKISTKPSFSMLSCTAREPGVT